MDCSLPGSSVHGVSPGKNAGVGCHLLLQGISWPKGWTCIPCTSKQIPYHWATMEAWGMQRMWIKHPFIRTVFWDPLLPASAFQGDASWHTAGKSPQGRFPPWAHPGTLSLSQPPSRYLPGLQFHDWGWQPTSLPQPSSASPPPHTHKIKIGLVTSWDLSHMDPK